MIEFLESNRYVNNFIFQNGVYLIDASNIRFMNDFVNFTGLNNDAENWTIQRLNIVEYNSINFVVYYSVR